MIDLPGTYAVCDVSIIVSSIFDIFIARALVMIFASQFDKVIGLQFLMSPAFFPCFGKSVIIDSRCEGRSCSEERL